MKKENLNKLQNIKRLQRLVEEQNRTYIHSRTTLKRRLASMPFLRKTKCNMKSLFLFMPIYLFCVEFKYKMIYAYDVPLIIE